MEENPTASALVEVPTTASAIVEAPKPKPFLSIRIEAELRKTLEAIATQEHLAFSSTVRRMIELGIEERDRRKRAEERYLALGR